jgi:protoporphyrinogen oxidase
MTHVDSSSITTENAQVAIVGGGFAGLSAAYELVQRGVKPIVFERDSVVGGLAGSFKVKGQRLEKFYHHWFTNDEHVMGLVNELGVEDKVVYRPTRTGMYYANDFYNLSTPLDLLQFEPLSFFNRIRLGILALRARMINDWRELEEMTAKEWLIRMAGEEVYEVVWEPLLHGKFGPYAEEVSAAWFWNKLKLRGGSRDGSGAEQLAYYDGGFASLAERIMEEIEKGGGRVLTDTPVEDLHVRDGAVEGIITEGGELHEASHTIFTPALPIVGDLVGPYVSERYEERLRDIDYLANVCLILELDRSLSETYWLNVNDPSFPYVGVIEHTNFEPPETYGGNRIVYLSKYLPPEHELYQMTEEEVMEFSVPHLQRMFPEFEKSWVQDYHVWKARYTQPVVTRHYSEKVPERQMPMENATLCTMAQIYPEDRGTNYAIREGRQTGRSVAEALSGNEKLQKA